VRIVDGGAAQLVYTTQSDLNGILKTSGVELGQYDRVDTGGAAGYRELKVERAFPVLLTADGSTRQVMTTAVTLDEMLAGQRVSLGEYDRLNMSLGAVLEQGDQVVLQRVLQTLVEEQAPIPFEVTKKSTSLLRRGRQKVLQAGQSGTKVLTYRETTVDGVLQQRELLATDVTRVPVEQVVLVGDGSAISNFDYSGQFPLDANGIPVKYQAVFRNQSATGYNVRRPWGAAGTRCTAGTVAVRADQFPYGTKLYIRSADGKFIYGYCVSNDTGSGLAKGVVDVDLYYDTYAESLLNSRRVVDIYVLQYSRTPTYK